ncbi:MAG TPA: class I SAM-dependent methyltransferase [Solirubrobacteraceae bacterium]|nr:class I SAM-dependent methyltransferase [Solirubrobacteraceae bacterium]
MSSALALAPRDRLAPAPDRRPARSRDGHGARAPYDVLAPVYDLLTGDYAYADWVSELVALARGHGLEGHRTLDVACGDGNATVPLLDLGHDVTGCDLSPKMVEAARARTGGRARLLQADALAMPVLGRFDLATCFGDVPNHLGSIADVRTALTGIRRNLRRGGMLLFDVNLLAAYRDVPDVTVRDADRIVTWWGSAAEIHEPGGAGEVVIDVFERDDGLWRRSTCRQPHRHHPLPDVLEAVRAAGLETLAVHGHVPGAGLQSRADEALHPKAVVLARRPAAAATTTGRR